ncbi:MAG: carbohydrate binding family 9 domain-containing protein [Bacteroidetes bacterium]|nr:carbohydrate binding family 9 domain-containing protein [Bacteroidota bacterium]
MFFVSGTDLSASTFYEELQDTLRASHDPKQPVYTTSRLSTVRPVIDGKLDDECWKTGRWAGDFHQYIPNEGAAPTWPTFFNIQYDDKYIYAAIRAFDGEPGKMQRYSGLRDEFSGDMVGVNFDSYHSFKTGFEFTISSWGQKVDLILFNPENWDMNWNAVWNGKTGMEDSAWVAEIEIPLSQLRYSKEDEQVWGLHVWRWINRLQEESDWEYQTKTGPGVIYNFGEMRGIKGLKKSQRLEIMPYSLGELETIKKVPGNPFAEKGRNWSGNAGLDAKIGISSNFTVDLTLNPDFGQVESDPSVMNLTAFETFYEEKDLSSWKASQFLIINLTIKASSIPDA